MHTDHDALAGQQKYILCLTYSETCCTYCQHTILLTSTAVKIEQACLHACNSFVQPCVGVVNGVQSSLQNFFQSLSFVAGLVFWSPQDFPVLMYSSAGVVVVAAVIYSSFVCCFQVNGPWQ